MGGRPGSPRLRLAQASHPTPESVKNKVPTFYCEDFYLFQGGRPGSNRRLLVPQTSALTS